MATAVGHADPPTTIDPDPPARPTPAATPPAPAAPSWDLDGLYLWLGPTGAAGRLMDSWDSTFGAHIAVVRVREQALIGAIGASLGASRWTTRGGARIWLDALIGTRIGRMIGITAGPILELPELKHPEFGGSVGLWAFVGVAPYIRVGVLREFGSFVELGIHVSLPALRDRD